MTATTYAADRTALLIVDPYDDFMSEGGKFYEATRKTAEAVGFYDNMRKLIPAIRTARIQVVVVPHHRWRERDYTGWRHMNPTQIRANQSQGFAAGGWGGEFHPEFGPQPGDAVVLEHWGQSGFANTRANGSPAGPGLEHDERGENFARQGWRYCRRPRGDTSWRSLTPSPVRQRQEAGGIAS